MRCVASTTSSERRRARRFVQRFWSRATDLAFLSVEIAYYPLLVFGIVMILWSG